MRTILFRGKRVDNNEWVYGFYAFDKIKERHVICNEFDGSVKVVPETVGQLAMTIQFNGKHVFEGDIVTYDSEDGLVTAKVIFKENEDDDMCLSGFEMEFISVEEYADDSSYEFTVIGNIHDYQELLP